MQYNLSKNEIRKSLLTSNYPEALTKARKMWVAMSENVYDLEQDISKDTEMLKVGRGLLEELNKIRSLPDYIAGEDDHDFYLTCNGYEIECLKRAEIYFTSSGHPILTKTTNDQDIVQIQLNETITQFTENIGKISEHILDDGLKRITIDDAVERYLEYYIKNKEENQNTKVPPKTKDDKIRTLKTLNIILGKSLILKMLDQDMLENNYVNIAKRIPQRLNTIYKYPSEKKNYEILEEHFDEIIKIGITSTRKKKNNDTLNREFNTVKLFLKWAEERKYVQPNLGNFIPYMVENIENEPPKPIFTDEDYRLLFNSEQYIQGKFKTPHHYWIPLIGIFTGCRGNEIAFLFKEDIRKHPENGIWYIFIRKNKEVDKRAKSPTSVRSIPIHPVLKTLGFLEYVESIENGSRIFPELQEDGKNKGDYYKKFGNWFNKLEVSIKNGKPVINKNGTTRMTKGYLSQCGVEKIVVEEGIEKAKTFHSFRHYIVNYLDRNTTPRTKNFIIGHKYESGSVADYINPDAEDLAQAFIVIKKLNYPSIDFSKIRKKEWRKK